MSALTLSERIEAAYDRAIEARRAMLAARDAMAVLEAQAKQDHADEWAGAKNNDVRAVLLHGWLSGEDAYLEASDDYEGSRAAYRLALLEIERLRLLVEARKAEGGRS